MAASYDVPDGALEKLKCSLCRRFLSCGPIFSNQKGEGICGRCLPTTDDLWFRNHLLEELLFEARFPCVNREFGCEKLLLFNEVQEHEFVCVLFGCPSSKECDWKGIPCGVFEHFEEYHEEYVLKALDNSVVFFFNDKQRQDFKTNYITKITGAPYTIQCEYDSADECLYLEARNFNDSFDKAVCCKLKLFTGDDEMKMLLKTFICNQYVSRYINRKTVRKIRVPRLFDLYGTGIYMRLEFDVEMFKNYNDDHKTVDCLRCCVHHSKNGALPRCEEICRNCCLRCCDFTREDVVKAATGNFPCFWYKCEDFFINYTDFQMHMTNCNHAKEHIYLGIPPKKKNPCCPSCCKQLKLCSDFTLEIG